MVKVLEIRNLNYQDLKIDNLSFKKNVFYSIVGGNNSGKTTLFRLISDLLPSTNNISCDGVYLNSTNINYYIQKIGVVERVNSNSFIYNRVYDEMTYPLYNLGYNKRKRDNRINKVLSYFNLDKLVNKSINELDNKERQILLIMISLLHQPKVLLLDSVLNIFSKEEKEKIVNALKKFMIKEELTIINFTSDLSDLVFSDKLVLLSNFKVIGEYFPNEVYEDDKLFYQNGLEIPFITDLSIKLKMYDLINKNYTNMKEMVDDIWP